MLGYHVASNFSSTLKALTQFPQLKQIWVFQLCMRQLLKRWENPDENVFSPVDDDAVSLPGHTVSPVLVCGDQFPGFFSLCGLAGLCSNVVMTDLMWCVKHWQQLRRGAGVNSSSCRCCSSWRVCEQCSGGSDRWRPSHRWVAHQSPWQLAGHHPLSPTSRQRDSSCPTWACSRLRPWRYQKQRGVWFIGSLIHWD